MTYEINAPAKINLALDVLRRREDGYHDLRMIMETLSLADTVHLEPKDAGGIELTSDDPDMPCDTSNLAVRAALLMEEKTGKTFPLHIHIEKRIPAAAGLAGGSADAAAVMVGVNDLFSLGIEKETLMAWGKEIGADVPYCIRQGSALAEGIGEVLTPLPELKDLPVILVKPKEGISTKEIFEALVLNEETVHPDVEGCIQAMERKDLAALDTCRGNLLEDVTVSRLPAVSALIRDMKAYGAKTAGMSGSGPTVFGLFEDLNTAKEASSRFREKAPSLSVFLTSIQ